MLERLKAYQESYKSLPSAKGRDNFLKTMDHNHAIRKEIAALAKYFFNRTVTNCTSCYIELHILLLKLNPDTMEVKPMEYQLRAGTLLHDPINRDIKEILTPHTLTEERALRHLAYNPNAKKYFTVLPDDIDSRIKKYLNGGDEEVAVEKPKRGRPTIIKEEEPVAVEEQAQEEVTETPEGLE